MKTTHKKLLELAKSLNCIDLTHSKDINLLNSLFYATPVAYSSGKYGRTGSIVKDAKGLFYCVLERTKNIYYMG